MSYGANTVHLQLRKELENYIKSQYFGKSPLLLSAVSERLDEEGLLYQKPFIESSPAYKSIPDGIQSSSLPDWVKDYFEQLSHAGLGIYPSPFTHQIKALEAAYQGMDLFVSTGTGSGKTECFMWPMLTKLTAEAKSAPVSWGGRSIRVIIMYPMNALVSDQVSRLRRLIGDPDDRFIGIFHSVCGGQTRRPQFGMYTGRTPYPGPEPSQKQDRDLERTLARMSFPQNETEQLFFEKLIDEGKIPAKKNMKSFLDRLHNGKHIPNEDDAELITRFEMQQFTPDILITNYSMLEYMLLRPREQHIWDDTKAWLHANEENKLLFIIDEAHMYRGSSGGEVALLIRRLFHKLEIGRNKVQFILTTASMPNSSEEDHCSVLNFANDLTASDENAHFCYLTGEQEVIAGKQKYDIPFNKFVDHSSAEFESGDINRLHALSDFWNGLEGSPASFNNLDDAFQWMYDNLVLYKPFHELLEQCRGTAVSLRELSSAIFPDRAKSEAIGAVEVMLAIAPLAKSSNGSVLFPARMHMLFRGIKGVYVCTNENCNHSHADSSFTLGEIFLSDGQLVCPYCGSTVYELYNDRRCGALFIKGYVLEDSLNSSSNVYLWRYPGQFIDKRMKEIHLYIPSKQEEFPPMRGKSSIKPCYLDTQSGFIDFKDDAKEGQEGIRKLFYSSFTAKGRPDTITFQTCPHCKHKFSQMQLTSFSTRGNQSFFNLIQAQFQAQPPVPGKAGDPDNYPNEGRKVLLFSDSRQRAAKLARDMSDASDITAARQLFAIAISYMEQVTCEQSMNELYDYFCLAAGKNHIHIFHEPEREKFSEDCNTVLKSYSHSVKRNRDYIPRFTISNAPTQMKEYILRLFCGGYNTLFDSATSWIEPTDAAMCDALDSLEDNGIQVSDENFMDLFNAWMLSICDTATALGHTIPDEVRLNVRACYGGYGLSSDWNFSKVIREIMQWSDNSKEAEIWRRVLKESFLDVGQSRNGKLYVDLSRIKPRYSESKIWYRCEKCSEITPFLLKGRCPSCGSELAHELSQAEINSLEFWRAPISNALNGEPIRVIDTEEHTAQLSHKDQRDKMWSKTECYELRFQDLIQGDETPVDILSSTTTMEVGIDIGSLIAVGLRNIPPMRENYQQRAGRAGRRGSSLSTIITFCEDGPHDTLYFNNPVPMFRGDPRRPWIDVQSEKLIERHLNMIVLQEYLDEIHESMDALPATIFLDSKLDGFQTYLSSTEIYSGSPLMPKGSPFNYAQFQDDLLSAIGLLKEKRDKHPELFGADGSGDVAHSMSLLDALYEEGIIPTYSFPKNVVSTYITGADGKLSYQIERGLDVAISEYAPGRSIVVDKQTYQIGGLYYPGSERQKGKMLTPANAFVDDSNYLKNIISCPACGWFGLASEDYTKCPFCGSTAIEYTRQMLRPWGFAPKNAASVPEAQLIEEYSSVQQPIYSTLPESKNIDLIEGCSNIRMSSRTNQRIIMMNSGPGSQGFIVCRDCGAAMPGEDPHVLDNIQRPYKLKFAQGGCRHTNTINVNLGYDFVTDMLVLEFSLDDKVLDTSRSDNLWLTRASQSLAEALRLTASKELDIEFSELVTGYRLRQSEQGTFIDIYIYDSLSSGAGYANSIAPMISKLLDSMENLLTGCCCDNACYQCLKHYRNQYVHNILDRFYALDLLAWGRKGLRSKAIDVNVQMKLLKPLSSILSWEGYSIQVEKQSIVIGKAGMQKVLYVYPAMWAEPSGNGTIFVSDALLKYAKPYALQKIIDDFSK